jgi:hypothetical protein
MKYFYRREKAFSSNQEMKIDVLLGIYIWQGGDTSIIYTIGCIDAVQSLVETQLPVIGGITLGIAFIQVICYEMYYLIYYGAALIQKPLMQILHFPDNFQGNKMYEDLSYVIYSSERFVAGLSVRIVYFALCICILFWRLPKRPLYTIRRKPQKVNSNEMRTKFPTIYKFNIPAWQTINLNQHFHQKYLQMQPYNK